MSTTPPGIQSNLKSFWGRPEGKTGMIFIGGIVLAGLWFWGLIVPYLVSMLSDTLHMAYLGLELAALFYLIFGKRPRLIYRLLMRKLTGLIIELDPIGIMKDTLLKANKRREEFNSDVQTVSGSKRTLKGILAKNADTIQQDLGLAEEAKRRMNAATDPQDKLRWQYQLQLKTNEIGRLQRSNESYQQLLQPISESYDRLVKMSSGLDFFIADLEGTVREEEVKYKTINSAYSAFATAMKIIRGTPDENDIYQQDLEFLSDNYSQKLGAIDEMARLNQNFLDSVDLKNGSMDTKAAAALDAYEKKLLTSGDQGTIALLTGGNNLAAPEPTPINRKTGTSDEYFKR